MIKIERKAFKKYPCRTQTEKSSALHEIERLKKDPVYIEAIARQELGLIGKKEIVINMSNITPAAEKNIRYFTVSHLYEPYLLFLSDSAPVLASIGIFRDLSEYHRIPCKSCPFRRLPSWRAWMERQKTRFEL